VKTGLAVVAIVLFVVAAFQNGLNSSWEDFTAFGLALFAATQLPFESARFKRG